MQLSRDGNLGMLTSMQDSALQMSEIRTTIHMYVLTPALTTRLLLEYSVIAIDTVSTHSFYATWKLLNCQQSWHFVQFDKNKTMWMSIQMVLFLSNSTKCQDCCHFNNFQVAKKLCVLTVSMEITLYSNNSLIVNAGVSTFMWIVILISDICSAESCIDVNMPRLPSRDNCMERT